MNSEKVGRARAVVAAMTALALLVPLLAGGAAQAAGRATAFPAFPSAKGQAAAIQWLLAETNLPLEKVTAISDSAVFAVVEGPAPAPEGGPQLRVRLREEVLTADAAKLVGGRSALMVMRLDCGARRLKLDGLEVFEGSNLQGAVKRQAGGDWMVAPGDSYLSDVIAVGCDAGYRYPFKPVTVAEAARPSPAAEAALRPALPATPAAAPPPAPPAPAAPLAAPAKTGSFQAQVGAFSNEALANGELTRLAAAFKTRFAGRQTRVEPTAARPPLMYRALVEGFASASEAADFCGALKAAGKPCMVRR